MQLQKLLIAKNILISRLSDQISAHSVDEIRSFVSIKFKQIYYSLT